MIYLLGWMLGLVSIVVALYVAVRCLALGLDRARPMAVRIASALAVCVALGGAVGQVLLLTDVAYAERTASRSTGD